MVKRNAGAAEAESSLDFADANWATSFKKEPIDFPCFAAKSIFKLCFAVSIQPVKPSDIKQLRGDISPIIRTNFSKRYYVKQIS